MDHVDYRKYPCWKVTTSMKNFTEDVCGQQWKCKGVREGNLDWGEFVWDDHCEGVMFKLKLKERLEWACVGEGMEDVPGSEGAPVWWLWVEEKLNELEELKWDQVGWRQVDLPKPNTDNSIFSQSEKFAETPWLEISKFNRENERFFVCVWFWLFPSVLSMFRKIKLIKCFLFFLFWVSLMVELTVLGSSSPFLTLLFI